MQEYTRIFTTRRELSPSTGRRKRPRLYANDTIASWFLTTRWELSG
jgi:hypothetical protein